MSRVLGNKKNDGGVLVYVAITGAIISFLLVSYVRWGAVNLKGADVHFQKEAALAVADAGIDYYRWHLKNFPDDFQDGTGHGGPYVHSFYDKNGNQIGHFSLDINHPLTGSSKTIVESTGYLDKNPEIRRTIGAVFGIPSYSNFAILTSDNIRFTPGTEVFGPVHSNKGIRFDGLAHNMISSSLATYKDPDHSGGDEFAVHTHVDPVDPLPPAAIPVRDDVFMAGRAVSTDLVNFDNLAGDLELLEQQAIDGGFWRGDSKAEGYHVVLKTNDTFDLYKVEETIGAPQNCGPVVGQAGWDTWSIEEESFVSNYPLPSSGVMFFADDVWVDGQIDGARLTIAVGRFPENHGQEKNITVNKNLLYTNYNGVDAIGLISQGNINVGMDSADNLRVDAALIAKTDRVGRYYYVPPSEGKTRCSPYHLRSQLTLYGTIGTNAKYGFAYDDGSGYQNITIIYDPNLLFGPPPSFPLASPGYKLITWQEITGIIR
ncbi:MAG: hypothetical protein WC797_02070 [Candidatus Paceibacterota bacterium]|jgi:hypothetical protein